MELYEPLNVIGSGSFGVIRKVRRKSDGKIFARKEIDYRKMSERERKQLVAEVNILRELRHPYIVRYFERHIDRTNSMIYIIMEYCEGGDLAAVVRKAKKQGKRFSEDQIWNLLAQLLLALHECHHGASGKTGPHPPILHRDIKPDNVFLDSQNNAKLGDFGLSRLMDGSDFARTYVGTPFYMSPELISESAYNAKSDIWALGCVIYELCTLEPPFQGKTQSQLAAKIQRGVVEPLSRDYSRELFQFMREMLRVKHERRPCTTILLEHPRIRKCLHLDDPEPLAVAELPHVPNPEEELRQRIAALEAGEAALLKREEEWRQSMAAREDYFNASMIEQEALLKKYKLLEQSLTHALRTKEQELAKKDQELAETKALLQQAIENQNNANHPVARNGARPYRSPLDDRAGYNKENILTSALGTFGMFGMRKAAKPPPTASLPTPPTSVSGSVPSGFSTHSAAAPASDQRRAIPALRRVQSTGMFQRPQSTTGVDDLVKGFHGFGVTPSPVKSDKQDFSLMMHLSP